MAKAARENYVLTLALVAAFSPGDPHPAFGHLPPSDGGRKIVRGDTRGGGPADGPYPWLIAGIPSGCSAAKSWFTAFGLTPAFLIRHPQRCGKWQGLKPALLSPIYQCRRGGELWKMAPYGWGRNRVAVEDGWGRVPRVARGLATAGLGAGIPLGFAEGIA